MNSPDLVGQIPLMGPPGEAQKPSRQSTASSNLMNTDHVSDEHENLSALSAHDDARALVRLIQCAQCSKPFNLPVTLPCGNTLCRQCLPTAHEREADNRISYPDLPGRKLVFRCPFADCNGEHAASDCNTDVSLSKVMESIALVVAKHTSFDGFSPCVKVEFPPTQSHSDIVMLDEKSGSPSEEKHFKEIFAGRMVASYTLASQGLLDRDTDVIFHDSGNGEQLQDEAVLADLLESTDRDVDCQVCYSIMLDPVTTYCGHTLCRKCLARVLDHSLHCPVCRRDMAIQPSMSNQASNKTLVNLLNGLCPVTIQERAKAFALEESGGAAGDMMTSLFVCTLGFPNQPTFLHVFEPRYRLMLRRCMEGNGQFGMLMYNRYNEPQGELGPVNFYHYGTMLHILHSQQLPDGTSLIETRGTYRFRVKSHSMLDGYLVGNIERHEDVPIAEEERIEIDETSQSAPVTTTTTENDPTAGLDRMSTRDLFRIGQDFITRMQTRSAPWLQRRVLDVHGEPPTDAALFPFWFASVLPINEEEKYKLMGTTTVRERLKITAAWIRRIESQRCPIARST